MRMSTLVIGGIMLVCLGFLPYLFHQAAQPSLYRLNTAQTALTWANGPDVELNAASLRQLNAEVRQMVYPGSTRMDCPFHVISLGKRRVEVQLLGPQIPSADLQARITSYIQSRLDDLARQQGP